MTECSSDWFLAQENMENNNFNGEKSSQNNQLNNQLNNNFNNENIKRVNTQNFNGGIRDVDVPQRSYSRENKFKEINLEKKNMSLLKKILSILFILIIIAGVVGYFFNSATFKIKNSLKEISFNNDIMKANNIDTKIGDELPFRLLEFNFSLKKDVKSKMIESVSEKATGKIKIINNTSKVQKLRKETRFEVNGKIFKTYKSVTIPAKTSVIKDAFADIAGEKFNLNKGKKMVIPGFKEAKDMDSYKNIVGEIAEDFTGGFVGKKDIPDKNDLEEKKEKLSKEIESAVMVKARTKLPKDFILNSDGIFTKIKYSTVNENGELMLVGLVNVKAIIFDEKDFLSVASGLDKKQVENYNIDSTAFLKFKILNKNDISIDSIKSFNFELNGNIKYNRVFNKEEFVGLIKGRSDSEYKILVDKNYSKNGFDISKNIFPFWMSSIPLEEEKISVEIVE